MELCILYVAPLILMMLLQGWYSVDHQPADLGGACGLWPPQARPQWLPLQPPGLHGQGRYTPYMSSIYHDLQLHYFLPKIPLELMFAYYMYTCILCYI